MTLVFLMVCVAPIFAGPILVIKIELGRKSLDCHKAGICRIWISDADAQGGVPCLTFIDDDDNFKMDIISKEEHVLQDERLTGDFFVVEEAVELPPNLMIGLGLKDAKGVIKPGKYPIEHQGDRFSINFGNIVN